MAFLKVVKGGCPGQIIELTGDKLKIGRHPSCEIVLDNAAVSRYHAQILQSHGNFYIQDLRSRNRTFLNHEVFEGRTELREGDLLKVCDVMFSFHRVIPDHSSVLRDNAVSLKTGNGEDSNIYHPSSTLPGVIVNAEIDDSVDASSIISTMSVPSASSLTLGVKPEAKLRAVLEISNALAQTLQLDEILQNTLDGLFKIFPQADEGFALLKDPAKNKLLVRATKSRRGGLDDSVRICMTIVKQSMEEGEAILSADAVKDRRFDMSESLTDLQIRSMMCVPLIGKSGDVFGVIQIDTNDIRMQFSQGDLDMFVSVASQAGLAVENAYLHEELVKQKSVEHDLEVATQIQLSFLPGQKPKISCYEFADHYESALHVGGDYFDYIMLPDGRVAVALGDVAGKGIPAALLMARLSSLARFHLLTKPTVAEAVTGLNSEIASTGLGHRFITLVVAVLNPSTNEVTIANAGHMPPLLRDHAGEIREVAKGAAGMPLGIDRNQVFREESVSLQHGEILTLFTDGVTEAMNSRKEIYGKERLGRFIAGTTTSIDELVSGIIADIDQFSEKQPQRDDMCLVCIKRCD